MSKGRAAALQEGRVAAFLFLRLNTLAKGNYTEFAEKIKQSTSECDVDRQARDQWSISSNKS